LEVQPWWAEQFLSRFPVLFLEELQTPLWEAPPTRDPGISPVWIPHSFGSAFPVSANGSSELVEGGSFEFEQATHAAMRKISCRGMTPDRAGTDAEVFGGLANT